MGRKKISKSQKGWERYRRSKMALTGHMVIGKDRSRQNRQDRQTENIVKMRGLKIEQKKQEEIQEKTV